MVTMSKPSVPFQTCLPMPWRISSITAVSPLIYISTSTKVLKLGVVCPRYKHTLTNTYLFFVVVEHRDFLFSFSSKRLRRLKHKHQKKCGIAPKSFRKSMKTFLSTYHHHPTPKLQLRCSCGGCRTRIAYFGNNDEFPSSTTTQYHKLVRSCNFKISND